MKKIISIISAICLLIAPYNVYAQEIYGDGSADATVTYHVPGEYVILIPETLSADGTHYKITASVMELCDNEIVTVQACGMENDAITLSTANGRTASAKMYVANTVDAITNYYPIASFTDGQLESMEDFWILTDGEVRPGDYTGTVTFNVQLGTME